MLLSVLLAVSGCQSSPEKSYIRPSETFHQQVAMVCRNTDASHFVVRKLRVRVKNQDGQEIELPHYNSLLPDGYYFCVLQERESVVLE